MGQNAEGMLAHHYSEKSNVIGWYMSRKLNGHRGIYKGYLEGMFSLGRYSGAKQIWAPNWWLEKLPNCPLDGEIWHESDDLTVVKSIAGQGREKSLTDPRWKYLTFQAFDLRPLGCQGYTWATRQELFNRYEENDVFKKVEHIKVQSVEHIFSYLHSLGPQAEGIMLANPAGYYEYKRSYNLLKLKNTLDAEAIVWGFSPGKNRHKGAVGALEVKLTWDEKVLSVKGGNKYMVNKTVYFKVGGLTDEQRELKYFQENFAGKEIKFTYLGVSNYGVPFSANLIQEKA